LPPKSYRVIDQYTDDYHRAIEIGGVDIGASPLNEHRTHQFFAYASIIAAQGSLALSWVDTKIDSLRPALIKTHLRPGGAYMVYTRQGSTGLTDAIFKNAEYFTAGERLLRKNAPAVSFAAANPGNRSWQAVIGAATGIVQSRLTVDSVSLGLFKTSSSAEATNGYQEGIANYIGPFFESVTLNETYQTYLARVGDLEESVFYPGKVSVFGRETLFLVPPITVGKDVYDQFSDGEIPQSAPAFSCSFPEHAYELVIRQGTQNLNQ
jgi:hypothetical protein